MNTRLVLSTAAVASLLSGFAPPGSAADCPQAAAAREGARRGYERDRAAALEIERRENASSEMIGKCIGGITSVVVVPTFPSLSDIFARAEDNICHVAGNRLREATTLPVLGIPGVPGTSVPVTIVPPIGTPVPAPTNFWERIWR